MGTVPHPVNRQLPTIRTAHFSLARVAPNPVNQPRMPSSTPSALAPTIRSTLPWPKPIGAADSVFVLPLPGDIAASLPNSISLSIEGILNSFPFRGIMETHMLRLSKATHAAVGATTGHSINIELTRLGAEPEVRVPADLQKALAGDLAAQQTWASTTPVARRDWILWIATARQDQTRLIRIGKACSMLAAGKRRVCCFGGLNWLTKDHPDCETWLPLPKPARSPRIYG